MNLPWLITPKCEPADLRPVPPGDNERVGRRADPQDACAKAAGFVFRRNRRPVVEHRLAARHERVDVEIHVASAAARSQSLALGR